MRNALTLFLIVAAAIAMPDAADNTAWFGTPAPPALSEPRLSPTENWIDALEDSAFCT